MASTEDVYANGGLFDALRAAIPVFDHTNVIALIATLIWLDRQVGKDHDDNVIVVSEELSLWLPLFATFVTPELWELQGENAFSGDDQADRALMDRFEAALARPFQVVFADPRHEYLYPFVQGIKRTIVIDYSLRGPNGEACAAYTATVTGERIQIDL